MLLGGTIVLLAILIAGDAEHDGAVGPFVVGALWLGMGATSRLGEVPLAGRMPRVQRSTRRLAAALFLLNAPLVAVVSARWLG